MSLCILNWFIVNTNGGNLIRTCYSETRRDYLLIKLVIVYRWFENLPIEWNKIIVLPFLSEVNNIISFFSSRKKASISSFVYFWENKGIMVQTLRGKQKYKMTNLGVEKIKLSRLLVQRINEFKINEIQGKTPQKTWPSWQTVIVSSLN